MSEERDYDWGWDRVEECALRGHRGKGRLRGARSPFGSCCFPTDCKAGRLKKCCSGL